MPILFKKIKAFFLNKAIYFFFTENMIIFFKTTCKISLRMKNRAFYSNLVENLINSYFLKKSKHSN